VAAPWSRWARAERSAPGGVCPLQRLIELLRVTEQDQTPRSLGDGDGVRKRDLARLIDDEHVERFGEVLR
jgi:hypothetical protein